MLFFGVVYVVVSELSPYIVGAWEYLSAVLEWIIATDVLVIRIPLTSDAFFGAGVVLLIIAWVKIHQYLRGGL